MKTGWRIIRVLVAAGLAGLTARGENLAAAVARPDVAATNRHYAGNRPPLLPSPFLKLPTGAIRPGGWVRKQLELEADGFVGHLPEISSFCRKEGNAWLNPSGQGGGTWEEVPYWFRGYCHLAYVLQDPKLMAEAKPWLENLFASQRADGWFGPPANLGKGAPDLMPNMSMLSALEVYFEATGDPRVLALLRRYFQWQLTVPDNKFFSGGWQVPRSADNLRSVHWLYNRTGEPFLLELAAKLARCGANWMGEVKGGHNVDFAQGFRKPAHVYALNKDPAFLQAAENNWESMYRIYGQVPGGTFGGDEFARPKYTDPRQAIETCGAVEMIKSEILMLQITGDAKWADRCEDVAVNTLPACFTADGRALRYLTSPNQVNSDARSKAPGLADGGPMQVMNPHDHRCCQHNGGLGWPCYADHLWMATPGDGLAAVFYAPCEVRARVGEAGEVTIREKTDYPFDGRVALEIAAAKPARFPLFLRVPAWCTAPAVAVNGKAVAVAAGPGTFIRLERTWADGDRVALDLPMAIRLRTWAANQNAVSVDRGPVTFSVKIAEKYVRYQPDRFLDPWPAFEILPASPWNYGLVLDAKDPAASFEVVKKPWPASGQPFATDDAPLELRAKARKIPTWTEDHLGLVDKLQPSPVKSSAPVETIALIPMGAGRLRLAAIPVIGDGPDARAWQPPPEPLVSYSRGDSDPYEAMFDDHAPALSSERRGARFTTYCFGGAEHGKLHWVQRSFDRETEVRACEVFWVDETPPGAVRLPASWRVVYRDGPSWKPVEAAGPYGIEPDKFNAVSFKPVRTTALRLEVQCREKPERLAMGIHEWRILDHDGRNVALMKP